MIPFRQLAKPQYLQHFMSKQYMSFFRNTGQGIGTGLLQIPQDCQPAQMLYRLVEDLLIPGWQIVKGLKETLSVV